MVKWKLVSVHLEVVLTLAQDRCTVCPEGTIGSEIIWINPMELLGDVGQVEPCFDLFGGSVCVGAR